MAWGGNAWLCFKCGTKHSFRCLDKEAWRTEQRRSGTTSSNCMIPVRPLSHLSHRRMSQRPADYCHSVLDKWNCSGHDCSSMVLETWQLSVPNVLFGGVGISLCPIFPSLKLYISRTLLYLSMTCGLSVKLSTGIIQDYVPMFPGSRSQLSLVPEFTRIQCYPGSLFSGFLIPGF